MPTGWFRVYSDICVCKLLEKETGLCRGNQAGALAAQNAIGHFSEP